jgi:hypothetical protein
MRVVLDPNIVVRLIYLPSDGRMRWTKAPAT